MSAEELKAAGFVITPEPPTLPNLVDRREVKYGKETCDVESISPILIRGLIHWTREAAKLLPTAASHLEHALSFLELGRSKSTTSCDPPSASPRPCPPPGEAGEPSQGRTSSGDPSSKKRDEIQRLLDCGDDYGLMLASVRAWLAKHHPEIDQVAVYGFKGDDLSPMRVKFPAVVAVS